MKRVWKVWSFILVLTLGGCASSGGPGPMQPMPVGRPRNELVYDMRVTIGRGAGVLHEATVSTKANGTVLTRVRRASERLEFIAPSGAIIAHLDKVPLVTGPTQYDGKFVVELPPELPRGSYTLRATLFADGFVLATRSGTLSVGAR